MSTDFLLELLSEEIPARMQARAKEDLARLFGEALAKTGISAGGVETFATPRRLALIARGLPLETEVVLEETKGPKVGAPPQALEGFLRKVGLTQDQLVERGGVYFASVQRPGRRTADVLAEAISAIIRAFPWPKSQRWGAASISTESLRWVRPLQGIVALLGEEIVACEIDGIVSGRTTMGHRFHSSGPVEIANPGSYVESLRSAHVIVHFSERCHIIREGATRAAADAGLVLVEDEGLVAENAGLTEWPVPMLGRFDDAYLSVPEEVIQLTARVNQKYFVCHDQAGKLANAFVCTANIVATDAGEAIIAGNEKVLAARLSDAKFFWEQDLKIPLDEQARKLSQITFHEKLGTVADKVERVAKLARWLCEEGIVKSSSPLVGEDQGGGRAASAAQTTLKGVAFSAADAAGPRPNPSPQGGGASLADLAERAARLCKADLVTGMVGEFPELQGIMGGYYARAQGEPDPVADAVRDHYKPIGQGDDVPTAPVTVAVSLADKLDTIAAFFVINERPTGSKDPFALRRAALGVASILMQNNVRLRLKMALAHSSALLIGRLLGTNDRAQFDLAFQKFVGIGIAFDDEARAELATRVVEGRRGEASDIYDKVISPMLSSATEFLADRLKVQQREAGVRHDLIDAVFALGGEDDLVRLLARVKALQGFVGTEDGANLLAAYKRAANILKASENPPRDGGVDVARPQTGGAGPDARALHHPSDGPPSRSGEDLALEQALNAAEPQAAAAVEAENFEGAMAALASLRAPIDAFFDGVMVNDADPQKRAFRLGLLGRFRDAVHRVADFSKIEG